MTHNEKTLNESPDLASRLFCSMLLHNIRNGIQCIASRRTSPLEPGDKVEVGGMASDDEWEHEMFVLIRWKSRKFAVPLSQLEGVQVDEETGQAIEDWDYWVD